MNKKFIIAIIIFLALVFAILWKRPAKFSWYPTYSHYDKQPFGMMVFDSIMAGSIPQGYTVSKKTFYQLEQDLKGKKPHGIVLISSDLTFTKTDVNALYRLAKQGNKFIIIANSINSEGKRDQQFLDSAVNISRWSYFNPSKLRVAITQSTDVYDTLWWKKDSTGIHYPVRSYRVFYPLSTGYVKVGKKIPHTNLMFDSEDAPLSNDSSILTRISYKYGIYVLGSCPMLYTNYGILDPQIRHIIFRTFSQLGSMPIIRTEAYRPNEVMVNQSVFSYFLDHEPLRWCLYLIILGVVLYCIFTARRRQRIIALPDEKQNKSLEFIQLIGTLYHHQHNNRDLLKKKYKYFTEYVRRQILADLNNPEDQEEAIERLSAHSGIDKEELQSLLVEIDRILSSKDNIRDTDLTQLIDRIDNIQNNI